MTTEEVFLNEVAQGLDRHPPLSDQAKGTCSQPKLKAAGFTRAGAFRQVCQQLSTSGVGTSSIIGFVGTIVDLIGKYGPDVAAVVKEIMDLLNPPAPATAATFPAPGLFASHPVVNPLPDAKTVGADRWDAPPKSEAPTPGQVQSHFPVPGP